MLFGFSISSANFTPISIKTNRNFYRFKYYLTINITSYIRYC